MYTIEQKYGKINYYGDFIAKFANGKFDLFPVIITKKRGLIV